MKYFALSKHALSYYTVLPGTSLSLFGKLYFISDILIAFMANITVNKT
jgi:hypothetical protein